MRTPFLLAAALAFSGCLPRHALPAPPSRDAPVEERRQALADLSGSPNEPGAMRDGTPTGQRTDYLQLKNGLRIQDPRDLLPWVEPDSKTAAFAAAFELSQSRATVLGVGGTVAPVLGISALFAAVSIPVRHFSRMAPDDSGPYMAGAAVCTLIGIGFLAAAVVFKNGAMLEREAAFTAYPEDLAHRLALENEPPAVAAVSDEPP